MKKKIRPFEGLIKLLIYLCAALTAAILVGIIGYVLYNGLGSINWQLLTTAPSELEGTVGILPMIINTLYIIVITLLISTPIGIGAAIYLNEYAKKGKIVKIIEFTTETLAGIPSIIYGLFGFMFFGVFLKLSYSILTGALTLSIMVLPTIIRTTQEALRTVPDSYRQGALGLGATKLHLIVTILIPSSISGILTSVILSIGKIVGESAALIFTAGIGYALPKNILTHAAKSGATLTVQLYQYVMRGESLNVCFAIASVLIIVVLGLNLSAKGLAKKFRK